LAYTLGKAERTSYGRSYPFEYDRRHALSLVANWRARRRLDVAVTARVASGFPRTPVIGLRVAERADAGDADGDGDRAELVPWLDAAGLPVYTLDLGGVSNLAAGRLPTFARVDLRATFYPGGREGRWTLYLDVINVLNRDNAAQLDPRLEHEPGAERPRLVEEPLGGIPILPSLGVRFRF
jgi:outer membrane receptor protein involved in Fe transport